MEIEEIGTPHPDGSFTLEEAFSLINAHVVLKKHAREPTTVENTGFVAGLITLNNEIEILIRFMNSLEQVDKNEFNEFYNVRADEDG